MSVTIAASVPDALAALAGGDAHVLAGGTDLMVEVNHGLRRPEAIVAVGRIPELRTWSIDGGMLRIGAAVTYTEMLASSFAAAASALSEAARTVGSPQIRNAGTIGGNVATASPAGDTLPVLVALEATVELVAPGGTRHVPLAELITGPKRTTIAAGELVTAVTVETGPHLTQEYLKVGTRNAMVIAAASCAVVVDVTARSVRVGLGSVGPVPLRAPEAEAWVASRLTWDGSGLAEDLAGEFGRRVSAEARPIDDHRSTAAYRRHAVGVLAARGLRRAFIQAIAA